MADNIGKSIGLLLGGVGGHFLNKKIGTQLQQLYISEISPDRTEIRLDSTILTAFDIASSTLDFITERANTPYFLDFYLNLKHPCIFQSILFDLLLNH